MLQLLNNMTFLKRNIILSLAFGILLSAPVFTNAQSVTLSASKSSYSLSDSILVTVTVQTGGQQINTVGGQVSFSPALLAVSDVRFGNSIISLWVDKPTANNTAGTIVFTGGTPGGYSGSSGNLFTFIVKPKQEGSLTITFKDVKVLLNDGSGGELQGFRINPLTLNITKTKAVAPTPTSTTPTPVPEKIISPKDTVPPENFMPMVSHHESIADDVYFVSFFAVDKDSGVVSYQYREIPKFISSITNSFNTEWKDAISPQVLNFQAWGSKVQVKAIDGAQNSTVSSTDKPFSTSTIILLFIVLLFIAIILTRLLTKRSGHARRR